MTLFSKATSNFFRKLVLNTMRYREENKIIRHDMIQLLMEARKGSLKYEISPHEKGDAGFATVEESNVGKRTIQISIISKWI
jgi:cytochrome P450 family 9